MNGIRNLIQRHASAILTCIGAAGMVCTVIMAVKTAPKAAEKREQVLEALPEEPTAADIFKAELPVYLPVIAAGTASLMCIFGANVLSRRQQAMMISAYGALERSYSEYRNRVRLLCGDTEAGFIADTLDRQRQDEYEHMPPWEGPQTFYLPYYDKFFERTMEEVITAEYHLNRNFVLRGYVTFNELLDFLHLEPIPQGNDMGWEQYSGEVHFGYDWIDFDHRRYISDDLLVCAIDMPFAPHPLDEAW